MKLNSIEKRKLWEKFSAATMIEEKVDALEFRNSIMGTLKSRIYYDVEIPSMTRDELYSLLELCEAMNALIPLLPGEGA